MLGSFEYVSFCPIRIRMCWIAGSVNYFRETHRGGHTQLFFESAIAIPQLEAGTSAIAIPRLLKKCNSAIPQSHFLLKSATSSPLFSAYFWLWSSLKLYFFYRQVFFAIQRILKGQ